MKKLTLSADEEVIEQAKALAAEERTSVSAMFARFVRLMVRRRNAKPEIGPLARRASGMVTLPKGRSEREVLEDALAEKYGLDP